MPSRRKWLVLPLVLLVAALLVPSGPISAACKDCYYIATHDIFICVQSYLNSTCTVEEKCFEIDGEEHCYEKCTSFKILAGCPV